MQIKSKGILSAKQVSESLIANDWPLVQLIESVDIRATSNLLANGAIISGDLVVVGDLTVQGNTVTLNTATLTIEDKTILIASGATSAAEADESGIVIDGAQANILYRQADDRFEINKTVYVDSDLITTSNLIANGLIVRNIIVSDSALTGQTSANNLVVDTITANVWQGLIAGLYTEVEPNGRISSTITAGENIGIEANGRISASSIATVVNDSQTFTATNTSQYTMNRSISDAKNILVIIEGLIQIPGIDYNIAGAALTFTTLPPIGAKIEVRYFGTDAYNYSVTSSLIAVNNLFDGTGASNTFVLSLAPASKDYLTVNIDGVLQLPTSYELEGKTLTFNGYPANGSNIGVQILSTVTGTTFSTRSYTGDGATNVFIASQGFSADTLIIFEDGIARIPGTDYTYDDGNVLFTYTPNVDVNIVIRELGVRTDAGGNVFSLFRGQDQVTGNLLPKYPGPYNIGNVNMPYNDIFVNNVIVSGSITLANVDLLSSNWNEVSSTYNAAASSKLFVDTSLGSVQVNLPASPSMGDEVYIVDASGTSGTNNIIVARNGSNIAGTAENLTIDVDGSSMILAYYNVNRGWIIVGI
jgi:hypothetical protein